MISPIPQVMGMAPYALADLQPDLLSLSQNESAYTCSPKAFEAGQKALTTTHLYSDPDWLELRQAIAEVHDLNSANILCGAGSMELIAAIIHSYTGQGDEVLGTAHGYLFVATACQQTGCTYKQVAEPNYHVSVDHLIEAASASTNIVFVCNPGNPTGTRINNSELIRLRESLADNILLVIDQAYAEFDDQDHKAIFDLIDNGNTIITRTLSKAYALAGQRVGWGAFPLSVAEQVRKMLNPNNVSIVAQAMGTAAMLDQEYMRYIVRQTSAVRNEFVQNLKNAGMDTPTSHTNFVLLPLANDAAAADMDRRLREAGFLVRGMGGYGLAHCLRFTIEKSDIMQRIARHVVI